MVGKQEREDSPKLQTCPHCKKTSLFWNWRTDLYECLNVECKRRFTEKRLRSITGGTSASAEEEHLHTKEKTQSPSNGNSWYDNEYLDSSRKKRLKLIGGISWTALLVLLLAIAAIGIIAYTASRFDQLDRPVAIGIISAAAIAAIWNAAKLRELWKYRPRKAGFGMLFVSLVLVVLIGGSATAFTGVEPLSSYKDKIIGFFKSINSPPPLKLTIASFDYEYGDLFVFTVTVQKTENTEYDVPYTVEIISEDKVRDSKEIVWPNPIRLTPEDMRSFNRGWDEFRI